MHEAVRRLGARLREVKAQEEQARRRAAHNVAVAERDKLATELAEVYPAVAERLADLAARIAANDAAIERVNRKLPDGSKWIEAQRTDEHVVPVSLATDRREEKICSAIPRPLDPRGRCPPEAQAEARWGGRSHGRRASRG